MIWVITMIKTDHALNLCRVRARDAEDLSLNCACMSHGSDREQNASLHGRSESETSDENGKRMGIGKDNQVKSRGISRVSEMSLGDVETTVQKLTFSVLKHTRKGLNTPFYNMGVTVSPQGAQSDARALIVNGKQSDIFGKTVAQDSKEWKYPRKLDNVKILRTEKGDLPVIHSVPCTGETAQLDWVTFGIGLETWHEKYLMLARDEDQAYDDIVNELDQTLYEIFGFGVLKKRDKGMHFYKYAWELQDNLGIVLAGHSTQRISVQINGTGCALAARGWQQRLYRYLTEQAIRPKLSRVDVAHDDFDADHLSVDWANEQDSIGGFWCGGRLPNIQHLGNWKRITGKGRTLSVGNRETGKYCRIYEKGKKEGDSLSLWTRAEVEFKGHDRVIPFDILISPSQYFVGAYPCFADFDKYAQPEKIATTKKAAKIAWEHSKDIVKQQFGKYIAAYKKVYSDSEIINFIVSSDANATPKRLIPCDQLALSIERNLQHAKSFIYTKFLQSTQRSQFDAFYS